MDPLTVAAIAAAAVTFLIKRPGIGPVRPMTLAELEVSATAKRLGMENRIPSSLRTRALGLGVAGGIVKARGFRVTSAFRSAELTAAIHDENAQRGVNQDVRVIPGPGDHDRAMGLDVAPARPAEKDASGKITPAGKARIAALRDVLLEDELLGPLIRKALAEDDHVHVGFHSEALEALGRKQEGNA